MTKPLIALPCTAQELENALHAVCDHGLWDAKVDLGTTQRPYPPKWILTIETETKGEAK